MDTADMICGIIPARGGSKGVPGKNIKLICGKPLILWTIEAAQASEKLDDFYVSTDCEDIAAVAKAHGAKVLMRPANLAQDDSNIVDGLKHVITQVPMDVLVLLQPTSPQRDANLIDTCIEHFLSTGADNLASGHMCRTYEYGSMPPNRQDNSGYFLNDGAVFIVRSELIEESVDQHYSNGIRLGDRTEFVYTDESMHYEIDSEFDFWLVEKILERKQSEGVLSPVTRSDKDSFIPLSVPHLVGNTATYLNECVTSGFVSSVGKYVDQFEEELASYTGAEHAVAIMNGTSALHLALLCCGVRPEQEVLAPSLTFVATINAIRYCGAMPVLFDVEPASWNIDVNLVRSFLENECEKKDDKLVNKQSKREVVGIVPVHLYGNPADNKELSKICKEYNLFLLEDAAESIGACIDGKMTGTFGEAGVLSFNGNKTITSGAGGAILTNDKEIANRAKFLSTQAKKDSLRYIHDEVGFNYRMSNVQAAVGLAQLEQLPEFLEKKAQINARYKKAFSAGSFVGFQSQVENATSIYWLNALTFCSAKLVEEEEPWKLIADKLQTANIQTRPLWYPLHLLPVCKDLQMIGGEVSEQLYRFGLCIPSSVGLTDSEQDRVISKLQAVLSELE